MAVVVVVDGVGSADGGLRLRLRFFAAGDSG